MLPVTQSCDSEIANLQELVDVTFSRNFSLAGRHIRVETHADQVVLRGFVRSYYQKQMAQESLNNIPGVRLIRNEIEVIAP